MSGTQLNGELNGILAIRLKCIYNIHFHCVAYTQECYTRLLMHSVKMVKHIVNATWSHFVCNQYQLQQAKKLNDINGNNNC